MTNGMMRVGRVAWLALALACVGGCHFPPGPAPGGFSRSAVTSPEVTAAADFAVRTQLAALQQERADAQLSLVAVVRAESQVVAGRNYRMRLKVQRDGAVQEADAEVWWQAWNPEAPYRLTSWIWHPPAAAAPAR